MKLSSNLIVQIISLILWALALAGLKVNPEVVGTDLVNSIGTQNWPLLLIIIINLGNSVMSWVNTWQTNRPDFLLFLRSPNWWISFCNVVFAVLAMQGIVLPPDAPEQIVTMVFNARWWALAGYLIPNVIGPIVRKLTTKPTPSPAA